MSRKYPRFIFSNPQNTKSAGPFIVHCLEPFIIVRVFKKNDNRTKENFNAIVSLNSYDFELLRPVPKKLDGNGYGITILNTISDMEQWFIHQTKLGFIDTSKLFV